MSCSQKETINNKVRKPNDFMMNSWFILRLNYNVCYSLPKGTDFQWS